MKICEFIPSIRDAHTCKTCGSDFTDHKTPGYTGRKQGRKRKLTDGEESALINWKLGGGKLAVKAAQLGICIHTAYSILHRHNVRRGARS